MPRCINTVGCRITSVQGQTPLCPAIPALHVPHIQPHPAGVVRSRRARGDSTRNSKATRREEREEEEEEATAAAGVRKRGRRTPHLPWLSHPAGQVGEDQEECGAQSQGPGSRGGVFVEKLENEIPWQEVPSPVPGGASEGTGLDQCLGSGVPGSQSRTVTPQGPGILSPWGPRRLWSDSVALRRETRGPRPSTGQYPFELLFCFVFNEVPLATA